MREHVRGVTCRNMFARVIGVSEHRLKHFNVPKQESTSASEQPKFRITAPPLPVNPLTLLLRLDHAPVQILQILRHVRRV